MRQVVIESRSIIYARAGNKTSFESYNSNIQGGGYNSNKHELQKMEECRI